MFISQRRNLRTFGYLWWQREKERIKTVLIIKYAYVSVGKKILQYSRLCTTDKSRKHTSTERKLHILRTQTILNLSFSNCNDNFNYISELQNFAGQKIRYQTID